MITIVMCKPGAGFQFLIGKLKTEGNTIVSYKASMFQFLIGKLKTHPSTIITGLKYLSNVADFYNKFLKPFISLNS